MCTGRIQRYFGKAGLCLIFLMVPAALSACGSGAAPQASPTPTAAAVVQATSPAATVPVPASPTGASTPTPEASQPSGGASSGDPRQVVIASLSAVLKAGPYRTHSVITSPNAPTTDMQAEVILPDRFHVTSSAGEFIIIGAKTYMNKGGKWSEFPVDMGSMVTGLISSFSQDALNSITDVSYLGANMVGDVLAQTYQYSQSVELGGQAVNSTVKMWIDPSSGLPIKMQIDGEYAGVKSETVQDIQYDPTITIEAPPVQ